MATEQESTVLVVEDNPDLLEQIEEHLSRAGYHVRTAANGWEALKELKEGATDLVVSESHLAAADGSSLREKLLLEPDTRDVPFVYLVPVGGSEREIRGLRNRVDSCVLKPFDPVVLVARVQAAIERRRIYEEMTRVDPLTRLLNRSSLENVVVAELERVRRYGRFASILLLDVDRFSQVNADEGHAMGDLLLTALAGVMVMHMRNVDIAGRYRGGKFMLYLPETQDEGALALANRMQKELHRAADAMTGLDVTFCAGIVEAPRDSADLVRLCRRAEEAVGLAKRDGGGSIVIWAQAVETPDGANANSPDTERA